MIHSSANPEAQAATAMACGPLLDSCDLQLYRRNAFRITGLSVDATPREISRHADRLKMMEELGQGLAANPAACSLDPPPSVDTIREALRRLKDPEQRLIDEFFWFWPAAAGGSGQDPAIRAILAGDVDTAYQLWTLMEAVPGQEQIGCHNIAVMHHLVALDATLLMLSGDSLDIDGSRVLADCWAALSRWEKVAEADVVWDRMRTSIHVLDDPRITTGFVRRMQATLPRALHQIHAGTALRLMEHGDREAAAGHAQIMRETFRETGDVEAAAGRALAPVRQRLSQQVRALSDLVTESPLKGWDGARVLLDQARLPFEQFTLLYGDESRHRNDLFDDIADAVNFAAISHSHAMDNDSGYVEILKAALPYALHDGTAALLGKNIAIGERQIRAKVLGPTLDQLEKIRTGRHDEFLIPDEAARLRAFNSEMMPILLDRVRSEGEDSPLASHLRDAFSSVLCGIAVAAKNHENDPGTARKAISLASRLAIGEDEKKKVADTILSLGDLSGVLCYYCGIYPQGADCNNRVDLYGEVKRHFFKPTTFRKLRVIVPRCAFCKRDQRGRENAGCAIWLVVPILCAIFGVAFGEIAIATGGMLFGGLFVGHWLSVLTVWLLRLGARQHHHDLYPEIARLRAAGWKYGEAPRR